MCQHQGPFALFYGGETILHDLSDQPPGRGIPLLIFFSVSFQVALFLIKFYQSRSLGAYSTHLRRAMVENVLNLYSLLIIIIIALISTVYIVLHHLNIENNRNKNNFEKSIPAEIIILFLFTAFCVFIPFLKSFALRYHSFNLITLMKINFFSESLHLIK